MRRTAFAQGGAACSPRPHAGKGDHGLRLRRSLTKPYKVMRPAHSRTLGCRHMHQFPWILLKAAHCPLCNWSPLNMSPVVRKGLNKKATSLLMFCDDFAIFPNRQNQSLRDKLRRRQSFLVSKFAAYGHLRRCNHKCMQYNSPFLFRFLRNVPSFLILASALLPASISETASLSFINSSVFFVNFMKPYKKYEKSVFEYINPETCFFRHI